MATEKFRGDGRNSTKLQRFLKVFALTGLVVGMIFVTFLAVNRPQEAITDARTSAANVTADPEAVPRARDSYGKISLSFESNRGQADKSVDFVARGAGYTLSLTPTQAAFRMRKADCGSRNEDTSDEQWIESAPSDQSAFRNHSAMQPGPQSANCSSQSATLRMNLVGGNPTARVEGQKELEGKVNYFIGNDPSKWQTDIPTFERVRYAEVYPGIDVVYYGNQKRLEYDFVVAPGREVRTIALEFADAERVEVDDATGDLLLTVGEQTIRQLAPVTYQETAGRGRIKVESRYALRDGGKVGFEVGDYDPSAPLVIDPVLEYSTYLGGSGGDEGVGIAVDSAGNAYIAGSTESTNFPTANPIQAASGGGESAFVTKLNAAGTAIVYSTYLGGSGDEGALSIAVDSTGNAYITGNTGSTNFPTANPVQAALGGDLDAFVTKLNPNGSGLVYSTYLGGSGRDSGNSIAVDSAGNGYLTGSTRSTNFPTANPIDGTLGGDADAFVTKFNAAGTALVYSTYLGGSGSDGSSSGLLAADGGNGIALDSAGNAYITGSADSTNFPTINPIQGTKGSIAGDGFVTKINAAGSALVYSTYLGGSVGPGGGAGASDLCEGIAVDSAGNAYVAGATLSTNFPTVNPIQSTMSATEGFVTKINAAGSALVYSTYLGADGVDAAQSIAVDSAGNAYVTGESWESQANNFPRVNPIQAAFGGGEADAYVAKINAAGTALVYSTYLGGTNFESAFGIAVDSVGSAYVTGGTGSSCFPTTVGAFDTTFNGDSGDPFSFGDAFISKIKDTGPGPEITSCTFVQLSATSYSIQEDCTNVPVVLTRTGDTSGSTTVEYITTDVTASQRTDYSLAIGRLIFAPGETSKTLHLLISEDSKVEGTETFNFTLRNPSGGSLISPSTATVQITDDSPESTGNALESNTVFICQHYHDFLNREPEPAGLAAWINILNTCPQGDTSCDRIEVSSAFYRSAEFQERGYFVYRLYATAFGRIPHYNEFMMDLSLVTGFLTDQQLEANKVAFISEFMMRPEFTARYMALNNSAYVNTLEQTAGITLPNKQALINDLESGARTRANVLRTISQGPEVTSKFFREAFVVEAYFGYLRREADILYLDWIQTFNQTNDYRVIVNGFLNSFEYRNRFGP